MCRLIMAVNFTNHSLKHNFSWNKLSDDVGVSLLPVTIVLGLYLITGILGNLIVVVLYIFRLDLPTTDRFFVPVLAVIDMASCLVSSSAGIYAHMNVVRFKSDILCKTVAFFGILFAKMSGDLLAIIAVDRYLKIVKPFETQISFRWKKISVILLSVISFIVAFPSLFTYGTIRLTHQGAADHGWLCANSNVPTATKWSPLWVLKVLYQCFLFVEVLVRFVALVTLYMKIGQKLYIRSFMRTRLKSQHRKMCTETAKRFQRNERGNLFRPSVEINGNVEPSEGEVASSPFLRVQGQSSRLDCQRIRLTLIFMVITVIYIVSMGPKLVLMVSDSMIEGFWKVEPTSKFTILRFFYTLFILNNVVNPFIYRFFDPRFRRELRKCFTYTRVNNLS